MGGVGPPFCISADQELLCPRRRYNSTLGIGGSYALVSTQAGFR